MLKEHQGYISDQVRLALFRAAIERTVHAGDTVADIGCGFGVLGLMCLQSGSGQVWGIDRTGAVEVARETFARAGLSDGYHCIHDHSFRAELPQLVDVLICDHVGYFGFDYGIIDLIGDARRRFLKPEGKIIPSQIRLIVAGVSSPDCRKKVEAWTDSSIPAEYHWLRDWEVNAKQQHLFKPSDFGTEPTELGTIDLLKDNPECLSFQVTLRANRDSCLDGLAGWFECELAEGVWMTNSPLSAEQVNREQVFLAFDMPINVTAGDELEVTVIFRHRENLIAWSAYEPRTGKRQKLSNWNSLPLNNFDKDRPGNRIPSLNKSGVGRKVVLDYVDGQRSARDIELAILRDHPDLFPTETEIRRFIQDELDRNAV